MSRTGVAVEKLAFSQESQNSGDRKCLGDCEKSFLELPDAKQFLQVRGERVFQQPPDFSTVISYCGCEMGVFKILRGYLSCLLCAAVALSAKSSLTRLFASPRIHAPFSNTRIRATDEKTTAACFKRSPFEAYFETTSCL